MDATNPTDWPSVADTILAWITEQERICAAATPGPWQTDSIHRDEVRALVNGKPVFPCFESHGAPHDPIFIATARTSYPATLAVLRANVELAAGWLLTDEAHVYETRRWNHEWSERIRTPNPANLLAAVTKLTQHDAAVQILTAARGLIGVDG